jgi:hypothetical protein
LGSSEILLRSNKSGLPTSDQLGKHFSGNGDVSSLFLFRSSSSSLSLNKRNDSMENTMGECLEFFEFFFHSGKECGKLKQ